jgi:hypothetical protein
MLRQSTRTRGTNGLRTVDGGSVVGSRLGARLGAAVGPRLGDPDGCSVGDSVGCIELYSAAPVGASVGVSDGKPDCVTLGVLVGAALGASESGMLAGIAIGLGDGGPWEGSCSRGVVVGFVVGPADSVGGVSVAGEIVSGLNVVGKTVARFPIVGKSVEGSRLVVVAGEDVPDVGETVDGEALIGAAVHSSELHATDSNVAGQACATPMVSADATVRVREDDPPPHATEQLLQPLQLPTLQSVHVIAEQAMLLDRAGHAEPPPYAASLTER